MGKKIYLFILIVLSSLIVSAQSSIQREHVLLEIFTGTWCPYCPGAALGADDLVLNGHDISIVEWHVGDSYQTPAAQSRDNYYGVTGYPSQVFDGTDQYSEGDLSTSMYSTDYLPSYNSAIGVLTPIDLNTGITVDMENNEFQIEAIAHQVASLPSGTSPKLYIVLTESHIPASWFGLTEINFVQRYFYEADLSLSVGNSDTIQHSIPVSANWLLENTEVVVWIQDPGSKAVYNSTVERGIQNNVSGKNVVDHINFTQCPEGEIAPMIELKNKGAVTMTSVDIEYSINGEAAQVINWTGSLDFNQAENIQLPVLSFMPIADTNSVEIILRDPNGTVDQLPSDNQIMIDWVYPEYRSGMYSLTIQPDFKGNDITWEVIDAAGATVASGGPYLFNDQTLITEQIDLSTATDCHQFVIYDAGGNGLTTLYPGYYALTDALGDTIIASLDGNFGDSEESNFQVRTATKIDELNPSLVQVFPNPSNGQFTVKMEEFAGQSVKLEVYQMNGSLLSSMKTNEGILQVDITNQPTGIYFLKVLTDQGQHLEKISRL